jgi:RNA polymerase sigma factor (sigma-70 family)
MATTQLNTLLRHVQMQTADPRVAPGTDWQLLEDFAARRDETAFTTLVARHGPMVLRVCRRVLGHEQDAEDAFQATFLVLARNTGAIRKRETVANWLHGVAYRTAMKAKRTAARRRNHEARHRPPSPQPAASPTWAEVQGVLDEEIQRLPEPFRAAFVLCVMEGKTAPEAAVELACKVGTVSSRLTRARRHLQQRLARRGISLAALLAALSLTEPAGQAAMPARLAQAAIRSGLLAAADPSASGMIPPRVAALAAGVTQAMFWTKSRIASLLILIAALFAAGAAVAARQEPGARKPEEPAPKPQAVVRPQAATRADNGKETVTYSGRVIGPDGRPVAVAELHLGLAWFHSRRPSPSPAGVTTGADGRFRFTVPKVKFGDQGTTVAATAANYGVAWVDVPPGGKKEDLTLRLVKDDAPITGQIVDLQGKPVRGATLQVLQVRAAAREDLGPWLEAVKGKNVQSYRLEEQYFMQRLLSLEMPALSRKVTTDAEGRFRLTGIGRNRLVFLRLDGPSIASQQLRILTRAGKTIEVLEIEARPELGVPRVDTNYYGAAFKHVGGLTRPVVGVVLDRDTKKPLVGAVVKSYKMAYNPLHGVDFIETTTDVQGRYRLTGMPKGEGNKIVLVPRDDQPYLSVHAEVPDPPGLDPATVDFTVKRGVWIEGKITDKRTGKPVRTRVQYYSMLSNPNLRDHPGYDGTFQPVPPGNVRDDGTYRVVGLPGPGLVVAQHGVGQYLLSTDRDDAEGSKEPFLSTAPHWLQASTTNAVGRINPGKGAERATRNLTLDPGETFRGKLVGPDGKPLTGVRTYGLSGDDGWERPALQTAEFTVRTFNPRRPRPVLFHHAEKRLVGALTPPRDKDRPVTVTMQPGATVTGRLVDADGQPRANVALDLSIRLSANARGADFDVRGAYPPSKFQTDRDGRFRIQALLPGYGFTLRDDQGRVHFGEGLRSGETTDLGNVQLKSYTP